MAGTKTKKRSAPTPTLLECIRELEAAVSKFEKTMPEDEKEKLAAKIKKLLDAVNRKYVSVDDDDGGDAPKADGETRDEPPPKKQRLDINEELLSFVIKPAAVGAAAALGTSLVAAALS